MEVSKTGLTILKHLKEKDKAYTFNKREPNGKVNIDSLCHYNEIKDLFPDYSHVKVIFEIKSLMNERIVAVNLEDSFSFPNKLWLEQPSTGFGLVGKGYALLENRRYKLMSKYLPLSFSAISILIALYNLFFNIYGK